MEKKKNPVADLEKQRSRYFAIGLGIALSATLIAFEWTVYEDFTTELPGDFIDELTIEEDMPIVRLEQPKEIKPPEVMQRKSASVTTQVTTNIVPTDNPIEDPIDIGDLSDSIFFPPTDTVIELPEPFVIVEEMPSFPGGDAAYFKYLNGNVKYPKIPRREGIEGVVYVQFVVQPDGSLSDFEVMRSVNYYLDNEALRVIKAMPNWKPGKQRGMAVPVYAQARINFNLE